MNKRLLTGKQQAFCENYVNDPDTHNNAKESAIKAGYQVISAKVSGCHNITNHNCSEYIKELKAIKTKENTYKIGTWQDELQYSIDTAKDKNQLIALQRGLDMKGKHLGAYQLDNQQRDEQQEQFTPEELAELKSIARRMTQIKVHKPTQEA